MINIIILRVPQNIWIVNETSILTCAIINFVSSNEYALRPFYAAFYSMIVIVMIETYQTIDLKTQASAYTFHRVK